MSMKSGSVKTVLKTLCIFSLTEVRESTWAFKEAHSSLKSSNDTVCRRRKREQEGRREEVKVSDKGKEGRKGGRREREIERGRGRERGRERGRG